MRLRWLLEAALALVLGIISPILYSHWQSVSYAQEANITTINPIGSFSVPTDPEMRIVGSTGSGVDLWFLLHGPGGTKAMRTDTAGRLEGSVDLSSFGVNRAPAVCSSDDGRLAVLKRNGEWNVFSQSGAILQTGSVETAVGCVFLNESSHLFRIAPDRVANVYGNPSDDILLPGTPLRWPPRELGLTGDRIGIIEVQNTVLTVVDTRTRLTQQFTLSAPEIQDVSRERPTDSRLSPAIFAASVHRPSGSIFAAISPYQVDQGATVLQFTENGRLVSRLRCKLIKSASLTTSRNRDGHFIVDNILVSRDLLLLVSNSQRLCLTYNLPKPPASEREFR